MASPITDVMTPNPVCVDPGRSASVVAAIMRENDIGDVVVVDDGRVAGIVTDRDLVIRGLAEGVDGVAAPVGILATPGTICLDTDASTADAVRLMREHGVRRLPVCDGGGQPVGIVSLGDLAERLDPKSALADISTAPANV